jgi:hypothetical protein
MYRFRRRCRVVSGWDMILDCLGSSPNVIGAVDRSVQKKVGSAAGYNATATLT